MLFGKKADGEVTAGMTAEEALAKGMELYKTGKTSKQKEAMPYLMKGAEASIKEAYLYLGDAYFYGNGVKKDPKLGLEYFEAAAAKGEMISAYSMGYEYFLGRYMPYDYQKSYEYFLQAANLGSTPGMNGVGMMYLCGFYVPKDVDKAWNWFQKAAEHHDPSGKNNLDRIRRDGRNHDYRQDFYKLFRIKGRE